MSPENNHTNPTPQPPEQANMAPVVAQTLPTLDELLANPMKLEEAVYQPAKIVHEYSTGDPKKDEELVAESHALRARVVNEIYKPEALVWQTERVRRDVAEEVVGTLRVARSLLEDVEGSQTQVTRSLNELDSELSRPRYHVQNLYNALQDAVHNPAGIDQDAVRYDIYVAGSFYEDIYAPQMSLVTRATGEITEDIRMGASRAQYGAELAEEGRSRALRQRSALDEDPSLAVTETMSASIERRGAETVEDHQRSTAEQAQGSLEAIADMRDDSAEVSSDMRKLERELQVKRIIEEPDSQGSNYENAFIELRGYIERFLYGDLPAHALIPLVGDLQQHLQGISIRLENLHSAHAADTQKITALSQRILVDITRERYQS